MQTIQNFISVLADQKGYRHHVISTCNRQDNMRLSWPQFQPFSTAFYHVWPRLNGAGGQYHTVTLVMTTLNISTNLNSFIYLNIWFITFMHLAHDFTHLNLVSTKLWLTAYDSDHPTQNLNQWKSRKSSRNSLESDETVDLKIYNSTC